MESFITVKRAREVIGSVLPTAVPEVVPLDQALGRVILDEVVAKEPIPPFANSAMDGYAVRSVDLSSEGGRLRLVGEVPAGAWPNQAVIEGSCVRIMTGAPMPEGADAVVPVEWTAVDGDHVEIERGIPEGRHIRPAGQDIAPGELVIEAGRRLGSGEISVLATLGMASVKVGRTPTVSVISTGDELVPVEAVPGLGQIRNSNGPALAARVREAGAALLSQLYARDKEADIERIIKLALEADVLVFSGGVSMGDYDLVRVVLERQGLRSLFWKVRQRPGKPFAFGTLQGKPVFGLPGNPVSAGVCFEQYVRPALARMEGSRSPDRPRLTARLDEAFAKPAGLHVFARGVVSQAPKAILSVRSAGGQGSNLSMSLVRANCIVHLPAEWESARAGALVDVELI